MSTFPYLTLIQRTVVVKIPLGYAFDVMRILWSIREFQYNIYKFSVKVTDPKLHFR